jgi:hypothetical protein
MTIQIHPASFRDRIPPFLIGFILLVCSGLYTLCFGWMGLTAFIEWKCLRDWLEVPAVVEKSEAIEKPSGKYEFAIQYHYNVANRDFHSHRYEMFSSVSTKSDNALSLASQYPVGRNITVHVDPADPNHAFVTAKPFAWWSIPPIALGLLFIYQGALMMWRSITAHCIVKRGVSTGSSNGISFYFFDSVEAARKAIEVTSLPANNSSKVRLTAFLTALTFACIGVVGLIFMLMEHPKLPEIAVIWGYVVLPAFIILGLGGMWRSLTAKYVLAQKTELGQEEISFYDSNNDLQKARSLQNQMLDDDKGTQK